MTITDIINELSKDKVVEQMILKVGKGKCKNKEDLAQDIYVELLTKKEGLIESLYEKDELIYYISKIVSNQIWSRNSPYYYTYERWEQNKSEIDDLDGYRED